MKRLYEVDKVAYVRFASVYKDFTDPESFATEVANIAGVGNPESADEAGDNAEPAEDKDVDDKRGE